MSAEEFVLIPKNRYIQERPIVEQVLNNPLIGSKGQHLSALHRYDDIQKLEETPSESIPEKTTIKEKVFNSLVTITDAQKKKSSIIYDRLIASKRLSLDINGLIEIDHIATGLPMSTFLHSLQQATKSLKDIYKNILPLVGIESELVPNKHAKEILEHEWIQFTKTPEPKTPRRRGSHKK
jgi:hypothetical protein